MVGPTGLCPASFLGLVHPGQASPSAVPYLSQALHPCPLRDHPSEGPSSRPEEVHGGRNLAALGLRNAATPSTSAMQVRCLQASTTACQSGMHLNGQVEDSSRMGPEGERAGRGRSGDGEGMAL